MDDTSVSKNDTRKTVLQTEGDVVFVEVRREKNMAAQQKIDASVQINDDGNG